MLAALKTLVGCGCADPKLWLIYRDLLRTLFSKNAALEKIISPGWPSPLTLRYFDEVQFVFRTRVLLLGCYWVLPFVSFLITSLSRDYVTLTRGLKLACNQWDGVLVDSYVDGVSIIAESVFPVEFAVILLTRGVRFQGG